MVGKCLASMLTMYWQSRDILLKEESPTLAASVVETNSNNNNKSTSKVSLFLCTNDKCLFPNTVLKSVSQRTYPSLGFFRRET